MDGKNQVVTWTEQKFMLNCTGKNCVFKKKWNLGVAMKKEPCISASSVFHNYTKYETVLYNKAIP